MTLIGTVIGMLLVVWLVWGGYLCWRDKDFWLDYLTDGPRPLVYWSVYPFLLPLLMLLDPLLEEPTKRWDGFLCYSHWNCLWASAIYGLARFSGGLVFLDFVEIAKENNWRSVAEDGIEQTDTFVFLESADSLESENVQHELSHREKTYSRRRRSWKEGPVQGSDFPRDAVKASPPFEHRTGMLRLPIPESPHPNWKYKSPSECSSEAIANMDGWLSVNLPAVETMSAMIGLPCPAREELASLMREYLEFAASGTQPDWLMRHRSPF